MIRRFGLWTLLLLATIALAGCGSSSSGGGGSGDPSSNWGEMIWDEDNWA